MSNEAAKPNKRVALGIDRHLDRFASVHTARTWKQIARHGPDNWKYYFLKIMNDSDYEVYFNLEEVEVWKGVTRAASGHSAYYTDWELLQIKEHPQWWDRVTWWKSVAETTHDPFEAEEHDVI